jgi:Family of unknown function (DUF6885)
LACVASAQRLEITLLPGARALLAAHERELPQRDDLCGAFCGALALHAAGIAGGGEEEVDQDAVALAAGSVISPPRAAGTLPAGESGRRDYRLSLQVIEDQALSGTTASGLCRAVEELSAGRLAAIPYSGPWSASALGGLFEVAAGLQRPVTLVANLATRQLWGARPRTDQLLGYLFDGEQTGPAANWDVGHFACVIGRVLGPAGILYGVADTYPSLGGRGLHLQPQERLALALERPGMAPGGLIVVAYAEEAPVVRAGAGALGLNEALWDNGTAIPETLR